MPRPHEPARWLSQGWASWPGVQCAGPGVGLLGAAERWVGFREIRLLGSPVCLPEPPAHVSFVLDLSCMCAEHWAGRVGGLPARQGPLLGAPQAASSPPEWPIGHRPFTHPGLPLPVKPRSQVASGQARPEQGALPMEWSSLGWREVKLIRPAPQRAGDGEHSSVHLGWVPCERDRVRAGRSQERLVIETVFWDFREEN